MANYRNWRNYGYKEGFERLKMKTMFHALYYCDFLRVDILQSVQSVPQSLEVSNCSDMQKKNSQITNAVTHLDDFESRR